jgi:hypothetical protein
MKFKDRLMHPATDTESKAAEFLTKSVGKKKNIILI